MWIKCLAQGYNTAPWVRIEPATLQSRVQRSDLIVAVSGIAYVLLSKEMDSSVTGTSIVLDFSK